MRQAPWVPIWMQSLCLQNPPFSEKFWQQSLHAQDKLDLHGNPLQDCILLNKLNVIYGKTNEKVHDDNGHSDDEDDEQGLGGVHVGDSNQVLAIVLVVKEQVVILHLPASHDEGFDDGKHQVAEILLVVQQHKEAETEGENEEQNNNRDFHEGVAHIDDHHNINPKEGDFPAKKTILTLKELDKASLT